MCQSFQVSEEHLSSSGVPYDRYDMKRIESKSKFALAVQAGNYPSKGKLQHGTVIGYQQEVSEELAYIQVSLYDKVVQNLESDPAAV